MIYSLLLQIFIDFRVNDLEYICESFHFSRYTSMFIIHISDKSISNLGHKVRETEE
jgi:hypothetical protein